MDSVLPLQAHAGKPLHRRAQFPQTLTSRSVHPQRSLSSSNTGPPPRAITLVPAKSDDEPLTPPRAARTLP